MWRSFFLPMIIVFAIASSSEVAFALDVQIRVSAEVKESVTIVGVTNLPHGSQLLISLRRPQAKYFAQAKTVVVNGVFRAGPFTANQSTPPPGDYFVDVTFPLAHVQAPEVRKLIGENSEKLRGKLVVKSTLGTYAELSTKLNIGGSALKEADENSRRRAEIELIRFRKESCEFIARLVPSRSVADCIKELEKK